MDGVNNPTDEQLSRAVAEKLGNEYTYQERGTWDAEGCIWYRDYATDWSLIGPEIEKRMDNHFLSRFVYYARECSETPPRAACLAILEEQHD